MSLSRTMVQKSHTWIIQANGPRQAYKQHQPVQQLPLPGVPLVSSDSKRLLFLAYCIHGQQHERKPEYDMRRARIGCMVEHTGAITSTKSVTPTPLSGRIHRYIQRIFIPSRHRHLHVSHGLPGVLRYFTN